MSSSMVIERAGMMMSVQDQGRPGFQSFGTSGSGAMDQGALAIANALVGNSKNTAGLEFAMMGGTISADRDCLVAVTGPVQISASASKRHGPGRVIPCDAARSWPVGAVRNAVWGYIAISGGVEVPLFLGSRATHVRTAIGGLEGRVLGTGDRLPLGEEPGASPQALRLPFRYKRGPIRIIPGPQDDYFDQVAWHKFLSNPYLVTAKRDRMAMSLDGPALVASKGHDIVSDATAYGSIQVPSSGQPIVLTADRQTTGGYPKIATVASADLARLVQTPSGMPIQLHKISQQLAEQIWIADQAYLDQILEHLQHFKRA